MHGFRSAGITYYICIDLFVGPIDSVNPAADPLDPEWVRSSRAHVMVSYNIN